MNDRQNAKWHMYRSVNNTCKKYETEYTHIGALKEAVNDLDKGINDIDREAQQQWSTQSKVSSIEKNELEIHLVQTTIKVSSLLYVYAFTTHDNELLVKTSTFKSILYRMHDNEKLVFAKSLASQIVPRLDVLAPYGINEALLKELEQAIADYDAAITKPRDTITEKKQYTGNLVRLFANVDSILYDRLDKLMVNFKVVPSAFFTDYTNARNLIITSARKKKSGGDAAESVGAE
jgi:hypothetical protein